MQPYSVKTLAARWQCSEMHIYQMIRRSDIRAFKLGGKLWRISAQEVERYELCDLTTDRSASMESSTQCTGMKEGLEVAARLVRMIQP
jgi:excisionase family DNA binding protein